MYCVLGCEIMPLCIEGGVSLVCHEFGGIEVVAMRICVGR